MAVSLSTRLGIFIAGKACAVATCMVAPLPRALVATSARLQQVHHAVAKQRCNPKLRCCDTPIRRGSAACPWHSDAPFASAHACDCCHAADPLSFWATVYLSTSKCVASVETHTCAHARAHTQRAHHCACKRRAHARTVTHTRSHRPAKPTRTRTYTHAPAHSANTHVHGAHAQVCRIDVPVQRDEPRHRAERAAALGVSPRCRCGPVPAQMWPSPGADVDQSRRRCGASRTGGGRRAGVRRFASVRYPALECGSAEHATYQVRPLPAQTWPGRVQSRRRCGRGEPSPGADVAGVSPVPAQMWPA